MLTKVALRALALCVSCTLYGQVLGYSNGPPLGACGRMTPAHPGAVADTNSPPYRITLSTTSFSTSGKITVKIDSSCGTKFKGFFLQAREAQNVSSSQIGSFNTPTGSRSNCGGESAVSHSSGDQKTMVEFEWTAPTTAPPDHVVFVATVVQSFDVFWVKFYSPVASLSGVNTNVTEPPGLTFPTVSNCVAEGSLTKDPACGSTKSCFHDCGSTGTCSFSASWTPSGNSIKFELRGAVDGSVARWIGLGFSTDDKMGGDTVIECAVAENLMQVNHSRNDGRSNSRVGALSFTSISLQDNVLSCALDIPKTNDVFDPKKKYTLLFATGRTRTELTTEKSKHSKAPVASSQQADLESSSQDLSSSPASNVLVKAHGSLMITAWVFMASFGLVVARYYKQIGGSRRWCGLHIWFQLHRFAMIMTFLLAAIAFVIIFVDVGGYSQVGMDPGDLQFLRAHPILGIISTALVVLNPLMALIRPAPDASSRPIFNWLHWGVGTSAWIVSIVAIFIGFEIEKSGVNPYTKYIMAAFVAYQILVEIILEVHGCMRKSQQKSDDYEMKTVNGKNPEVARHSMMKPGSILLFPLMSLAKYRSVATPKNDTSRCMSGAGVFRTVILVAHFFILLGFLIALLALVNLERLMDAYNALQN